MLESYNLGGELMQLALQLSQDMTLRLAQAVPLVWQGMTNPRNREP